MARYKLGVVPYFNATPLWVPLELGLVASPHELIFHRAVPDRLARDLLTGQCDVALLSVVEGLKNFRLRILDGVCIASRGPVETVQLFHQKPLADCRSILLDSDSRTGAMLTRILLHHRYPLAERTFTSGMARPSYFEIVATPPGNGVVAHPVANLSPLERAEAVETGQLAPTPLESPPGAIRVAAGGTVTGAGRRGLVPSEALDSYDAFLSIGDKTWEFLTRCPWEHTDLGALFTETTDLPMVWAAWIGGDALRSGDLPKLLVRAMETGQTITDQLAQRAARLSDRTPTQLLHYLTEVMHYQLGPDERAGLQALFDLGAQIGVLPKVGRINFARAVN